MLKQAISNVFGTVCWASRAKQSILLSHQQHQKKEEKREKLAHQTVPNQIATLAHSQPESPPIQRKCQLAWITNTLLMLRADAS